MKTSWEKTKSGRTDYCHVLIRRVELGSHHGSGQSDNAGFCTHQEFLEGRFQAEIRDIFSAGILRSVVAAVNWIGRQPDVIEHLQLEAKQLENWQKIPIEQSLNLIASEANEDGYRDNYGTGPNKTTVVHLTDKVKLVAGRNTKKSYLLKADGSKVVVPVWSSPIIGHGGFAYCACSHLYIIDVNANFSFDTRSMTQSHGLGLGQRFRISNIIRKGDQVLAEYRSHDWFEDPSSMEVMGRSGLLQLEPKHGIVGRLPAAAK